jgi:hypothetical protein
MKQLTFITAFTLCMNLSTAFSQIVIENVLFDNYISVSDNDFVNHFTGGLGLTQITTNGITGGCLTTPNTVNWGTDNAIYCSKYVASETDYSDTRIAFKYDTTHINSSNFDRAVSIFLRPSVDFNHYIIASVTYTKRIQIVTYSWANTPPLVNLLHGHWYQFLLNTDFVTGNPLYQINVSASVYDLGTTGQFPPIPVGNSTGTFYDSLLFGDTAVQVSLTGTLWGGAKYLDNFHFEGVKSSDSCLSIPTLLPTFEQEEPAAIISDNKIIVTNNLSTLNLNIYSLSGQKIFSEICSLSYSSFSISDLPQGIYFLRYSNAQFSRMKKFVITK